MLESKKFLSVTTVIVFILTIGLVINQFNQEDAVRVSSFPEFDGVSDPYVPISVSFPIGGVPDVLLCQINWNEYHRFPPRFAMFRQLVAAFCPKTRLLKMSITDLASELKRIQQISQRESLEGKLLSPNGFIFHESRCGSTLCANMLASNPKYLVYSESSPITDIIHRCTHCSRQQKIDYLRIVMTAMGYTRSHSALFFKFQSALVPAMGLLLDAFADTPWIFLFRHPVHVMMSHLKEENHSPPCLRSRSNPPPEVLSILKMTSLQARLISNHQYCAAHLAMLCSTAIQEYGRYGGGLMINYNTLPNIFFDVILQHFHQNTSFSEKETMFNVSAYYSKSKAKGKVRFQNDSEQKEKLASKLVNESATEYLLPLYEQLTKIESRD